MKKDLILTRVFQAWVALLGSTFVVGIVMMIINLCINGVPYTPHFEF
ncbi:MAG: hypothetical protein H8E55_05990 [Pelagibacterales bacterium]|nr:hypothetical protein [Pelagibacterales bacterium]